MLQYTHLPPKTFKIILGGRRSARLFAIAPLAYAWIVDQGSFLLQERQLPMASNVSTFVCTCTDEIRLHVSESQPVVQPNDRRLTWRV